MKTLVIGAGGFAGRYLLKILEGEVCATIMNKESVSFDNAEVKALDICDEKAVLKLFEEVLPDRVYHLAAQSSAKLSWERPAMTAQVNIVGTINILEAMRKFTPKARLLITGSAEEYGDIPGDLPIMEKSAVNPVNPYAVTKLTVNILSNLYSRTYGMNIILARSFNHIGAGQPENFVAPSFCKQVAEIELHSKPPVIYVGNLSSRRDFTDVRDVVRAYTLLMQHGKPGETYNVGGGEVCTVYELLDKILSLSACEISVNIDKDRFRPADAKSFSANTDKLKRDTGFVPEIPLMKSLSDLLDYEREKTSGKV